MPDYSHQRLRCERIQNKPKQVIQAPNFRDWVDALANLDRAARYNEIADCIRDGRLLPATSYRHGIERDGDPLLVQEGIKHLHLDEGSGDELLFCVEYEDAVVFLEINSHKHFGTEPPGSVLLSLHNVFLNRQDQEAEGRKKTGIAGRIEAVKSGLLKRRSTNERAERDESSPHGKDS